MHALWAKQDAGEQAERNAERAEREAERAEKKMAAEQDARQQAMLEKWAAEQQKMWAEHKASLREAASRWRVATEVRPERLECGETRKLYPTSRLIPVSRLG